MAIALYKLRERLVGYTEESCSRDRCHLVPSTSKLKSVRGDNDPNKLSPNLGDLAHWVLQSSTTQPNKAVIRTFREPHQFLCGRSNGTVLLTDRESPCEHWDVIFLADGTYGLRSWTGNWMSRDEDRVTTRKRKDSFVLEKWNAPSPVTRSRFLRALLPLRQWRTRPSIAAQL
ncbi:hypothetical protein PRIPAC_73907 [Pristionchus pacificus]|uniref:Uncharacterized protein n=1 Tax=Pristionchus pacificus TaxID=54126 RepID=A0A2A6CET4_PRIPA|nr:hypothetical protein PRIPAC_73907 [Pristionchus pacificus]|eukprot:PDM76714.1 hypothetical protein PRIPAC_42109 [Pristionchus pacificus]